MAAANASLAAASATLAAAKKASADAAKNASADAAKNASSDAAKNASADAAANGTSGTGSRLGRLSQRVRLGGDANTAVRTRGSRTSEFDAHVLHPDVSIHNRKVSNLFDHHPGGETDDERADINTRPGGKKGALRG